MIKNKVTTDNSKSLNLRINYIGYKGKSNLPDEFINVLKDIKRAVDLKQCSVSYDYMLKSDTIMLLKLFGFSCYIPSNKKFIDVIFDSEGYYGFMVDILEIL